LETHIPIFLALAELNQWISRFFALTSQTSKGIRLWRDGLIICI